VNLSRLINTILKQRDMEKITGFTPGDWEVDVYDKEAPESGIEVGIFPRNGGRRIAEIDTHKDHGKSCESNARLIALAPTLYEETTRLQSENDRLREALESCLCFIDELKDHGITNWSGEEAARAALNQK
jgi:hypothetical protein